MTTTTDTITNSQINALRTEAHVAGDVAQVAMCDLALGAEPGHGALADLSPVQLERMADTLGLAQDVRAHRATEVQVAARAECARVIADAEAQS